jgi:hypothetical protein
LYLLETCVARRTSKIRLSEKPGQAYRYCKRYLDD